jgi:2-hydroxy-4-carboxymuconate semialdehyde hemiacetal dehydrogenase
MRTRSWTDSVSWHHAAHAVDLAHWLLQEPLDCIGAILGLNPDLKNEVDLSANFRTPSGAIVTIAMSYNSRIDLADYIVIGENATFEFRDFSVLRRNDTILVQEGTVLQSLESAYGRYAADVTAGLRSEAEMPVTGAELLPVMAQLQRIHDLAYSHHQPANPGTEG